MFIIIYYIKNLKNPDILTFNSTFKGIPYYVSKFDGYYWIPEIDTYSRICKYKESKEKFYLIKKICYFDFGNSNKSSFDRKNAVK